MTTVQEAADKRAKKAWSLPVVEVYDPYKITRSESDSQGFCGVPGGGYVEHRLALPDQVRRELGV